MTEGNALEDIAIGLGNTSLEDSGPDSGSGADALHTNELGVGGLDTAEPGVTGMDLDGLDTAGLGTTSLGGDELTNDTMAGSQNAFDQSIRELDNMLGSDQPPPSNAVEQTSVPDKSKFIWGIPLEVSVIIGRAELSVAQLMELKTGNVIKLDKRINEPLEIVINGRSIARGEITMMEDDENRFGIKITDIVGQ